MRVECVSLLPTLPQARRLGRHFRAGKQEFPLELGAAFDVFAVVQWDCAVWIFIEAHPGYLLPVPLCLFKIIENSLPDTWSVHLDERGDIGVMPRGFDSPYFLDDLSEGKSEASVAFMAAKAGLAAHAQRRTQEG